MDSDGAQEYGRTLLVGEHVRLRALRDDDLPELEAWWGDPEWQPLQQPGVRPRPAGAAAELFRSWSANDSPTSVGFSIESRSTGALVGHTTLYGASLPVRDADFTILLGPENVGRGLGPDAVRLMVRYGFLAMGLNRIELRVTAYNSRARHAYAAAGFVQEGVRREAVFFDGELADEVLMAVLRRDWIR